VGSSKFASDTQILIHIKYWLVRLFS